MSEGVRDELSRSVLTLKNVGQKKQQLLSKLGITDIRSLISYFPRGYIDYSSPVSLDSCVLDENNVFKATVIQKRGTAILKSGLSISKIIAKDTSCNVNITIILFNNKFTYDAIKQDETYYFYGKITQDISGLTVNTPSFHNVESDFSVTPIYRLTAGIGNGTIISLEKQVLFLYGEYIIDFLSEEIRERYSLANQMFAIHNIHLPTDSKALELSKKRLAFNELLVLQLGLVAIKENNKAYTAVEIKDTDLNDFYKAIPFTLTGAQQKVIQECTQDITKKHPMNRLIQGDVGSGKTMVSIAVAYIMAKNGYQTVVMAPTEILAGQHYDTFNSLATALGYRCCLLTGSLTAKEKRQVYSEIESGTVNIIIGTHAVISEKVVYHNIGLVVTDEQHRFGVNQRAKLQLKGDKPHTLVMSATPIPRTLALIIYGDLDVSIIDELPKGRQVIETYCIDEGKRGRALGFVKKAVDNGNQAYIVCPAIEESETGVISVDSYQQELIKTPLGQYNIAVLHGKLKANQKDQIMRDFKDNKINILISTTVVEVGVDVPNATIMMIESAQQFGLSQLHQLRGRVGRGADKSYCILVTQGKETARLKAMCKTTDGFEIAKQDLNLRGPGDFFGSNQHGLPTMKIADISADIILIEQTQGLAREILEKDPLLELQEHALLKKEVDQLFNKNEQYILN